MKETKFNYLVAILGLAFLLIFSSSPEAKNSEDQTLNHGSVSLQFKNIELTELLQILAQIGQTNFLLSETIGGTISVSLNNTSWQTALHSILASRGLRIVRNGDIYWIGPHSEIQAFQKFRREDAALPFGGDHINSPRQILIEARIVEADERFARELGLKLGYEANHIGANPDQKINANLDLAGAGLGGFNPLSRAPNFLIKPALKMVINCNLERPTCD